MKSLMKLGLLACGFACVSLMGTPGAWATTPRPTPAQPQATADVDAQTIQYKSGEASISAYLAKPKSEGKHAAIIIVHDVAGLNDQVQDVARRFAGAGYVTLAPNLLSRTPAAKSSKQIFAAIAQLPLLQPVSDLKAAYAFLQQDPGVDSAKISVVAFGWGGWRAFKFLEDSPSVYKAIIFYGSTPADDFGLANIRTPILGHYARFDYRDTANALLTKKELGAKYTYYIYEGADRGFFMPDPQPPYGFEGAGPEAAANAAAAKLSWTRTLDYLKGSGE